MTPYDMTPEQLRLSAQQLLETNILPFWAQRMVDDTHGGFYGRIDGHNQLHPDAPKGAVLNARILWTFSAAYRVIGKPQYLQLATRARDYIRTHFLDPEYGGTYWALNADGTPRDTKKQTYALGFMLYGFSEYYRATGDDNALQTAIRLFETIQAHTFDNIHIGYVEALTRDWQPIQDMRLSDLDENGSRTMNTHLHILEPYTNLYRIWKNPQLEHALRTLIHIFTDRLFNPATGHLDLFFDDCWNGRRDKHSPGHDIEAAWLLNEALQTLGDHTLAQQTTPVVRRLADEARHDIMNETQWWTFCEAVIGYIDQWQQTDNPDQWQQAMNAYHYIDTQLVDRQNGEWHWGRRPDGTIDHDNDKAGFWKCPYHNSRMCLEIIQRLA